MASGLLVTSHPAGVSAAGLRFRVVLSWLDLHLETERQPLAFIYTNTHTCVHPNTHTHTHTHTHTSFAQVLEA